MLDYHQPNFYKFSEDSLLLRDFVLEQCKLDKFDSLIDVGAGCGVVGIELANIMQVEELSLFEKQTEFKEYILENIDQLLKSKSKVNVFLNSFEDYEGEKVDLIVANPPYFFEGEGRLPENENKKVCRFTEPEFFMKLDQFIKDHLTKGGKGFYLYRHDLIDFEGSVFKLNDNLSIRMIFN